MRKHTVIGTWTNSNISGNAHEDHQESNSFFFETQQVFLRFCYITKVMWSVHCPNSLAALARHHENVTTRLIKVDQLILSRKVGSNGLKLELGIFVRKLVKCLLNPIDSHYLAYTDGFSHKA